MIFKQISHQEKRKNLKEKLNTSCLRFVGSFSPLVSRLIEQKGFDGIYISGGSGVQPSRLAGHRLNYPDRSGKSGGKYKPKLQPSLSCGCGYRLWRGCPLRPLCL